MNRAKTLCALSTEAAYLIPLALFRLLFAVSRLLILPAEIYVVFECHSSHLPKNNLQNAKFIVDNSPNKNYIKNKFRI